LLGLGLIIRGIYSSLILRINFMEGSKMQTIWMSFPNYNIDLVAEWTELQSLLWD
jgi:hypothetical protein